MTLLNWNRYCSRRKLLFWRQPDYNEHSYTRYTLSPQAAVCLETGMAPLWDHVLKVHKRTQENIWHTVDTEYLLLNSEFSQFLLCFSYSDHHTGFS